MVAFLLAACGTQDVPRASSSPSSSAIGDWPMYRGDPARDGHPAGATLTAARAKKLKAAWQAELVGPVNGTPVVAGGVVVAASAGGVVGAYRLDTGSRIWEVGGFGRISGSPTIAGVRVFVGTLDGHLLALDLGLGTTLWDARVSGERPAIWSSPAVYGQAVLVGVGSQYGDSPLEAGRIVALDIASGRQVWSLCARAQCAAGDGIWSTPAFDAMGHGYIGVGNPDDGVLAFDATTGKGLWMTSFHPDAGRDVDVGATPIVLKSGGRDVVAVGSNAGVFKMLDAASGSVIWSRDLVNGSAVHGLLASPAYDGQYFYVPSAGDPSGLYALAVADGKTAWTNHAGLPVYSSPAIGNGVVVFGTGDVFGDPNEGAVQALSSQTGVVLWSTDLHSAVFSAPALSGDTLLIGDSRGDVIAYRPSA